jgi:glutathione synthase/RimK-type ligase-like ATP-grasp enzyme
VRPVCVVTCSGHDVDPDSPVLLDALRARGVAAELVVWDDPSVDWDRFALCVVRSTWDYTRRRAQFLRWARGVSRLANPYPVIEYSTDKHYLADVEARGYRVVPSVFCDVGSEPVFPAGNFVVKPCVGAGSRDTDRYRDTEHERARAHVRELHGEGRDALIQPYVHSVDESGERALVFIDGSFSHAMTKGAMLNVSALDRNFLYRTEQLAPASAEPEALDFAQGLLYGLGYGDLLYARVDLVRLDEGWALMELELAEPSLFLGFEPRAAVALARAIERRAR